MSGTGKAQNEKKETKVSSTIAASNEEVANSDQIVFNEPIDSRLWMIAKCAFSGIALPCYAFYFKKMFDEGGDMRVWEDLYGRSVFFFLSSVAGYLYYSTKNEGISFFELEAKIRWLFALRLLSCGTSYGCLTLALSQGKTISIPILTILSSQSLFRLFVHYSSNTHNMASKILSFILLALSLVGLGCLYSDDASPNPKTGLESQTKGLKYYNEKTQFVYSLAASILFTIGQAVMYKTKNYIHHSIDTIYVSLSMTLVTPSFVLSDYSMYPTKFSVSGGELLYYFIGGVLTWIFHSQITQVASQPKETVSNPEMCLNSLMLAFVIACVIDSSAYGSKLGGAQLAGACLLIVPGLFYDSYCYFKRCVRESSGKSS